MPSNYWIKAYVEILDDPKMATLPDRLWRRTMELFLLAGKFNKDGELPDTKQLAWSLRMSTDDLDLDLRQIELTGIIQHTAAGWLVVNYTKRQAASPAKERMSQWRERQQQQQYYQNVTQPLRPVTQNQITESESESDTESDTESEQKAAAAFVDVSSLIMPMIARVSGMASIPPKEMQRTEQLISMVQSYGLQETEAVLKSCCDRWRKTPRKNGSGFYSVTNMGWVDWAQDELVGKPPEEEKPIVVYVPPPPSKPTISLKEYREKQRECDNTVSTT